MRRLIALGSLFVLCCWLTVEPAVAAPKIVRNKDNPSIIEVVGLSRGNLDALRALEGSRARGQFARAFRVHVGKPEPGRRGMAGSYSVVGDVVRFEPAFPLQKGVRYSAVLEMDQLPKVPRKSGVEITAEFFTPKAKVPPTRVTGIYPSSKVLPENQLKFYVHFSAAMSKGFAYKNIRLRDSKGKVIADPWLELQQELWDPKLQRFTLLIDPGRIKRGLKPREEVGPVLEEGKSYTLEVDAKWHDANGKPLTKTVKKAFSVVAPDEKQPDIKTWKLDVPPVGSTKPLVVRFPEPLDHSMLQHALWVETKSGDEVRGSVEVTAEETKWVFTPRVAWISGEYFLLADTTLEDRAGNNIDKPFEVDVFRKVDERIQRRQVKRSFRIGAGK